MKAAKTLIALAAAALFGAAFAQSTPPNTAAKDPAVGAGQRSTQNTPMGTTGTPGGGATMSSNAAPATTTTVPAGSGTSMGASITTDTSATATTSSSSGTHKAKKKSKKHKARSDRG